jgi:phage shock protein PspC (stress-responsive transcriptional regulator)
MTASTPYSNEPVTAPRRLHRSRSDRVLAGVCAGVADYLGSDPTMVRLVTAVVGLLTGIVPMLVLYVIAALVIPEDGSPAPIGFPDTGAAGPGVRAGAGSGRGALIVGALFLIVGAAALADRLWAVDWDLFGPVVLMGIGAAFLLSVVSRGGGR